VTEGMDIGFAVLYKNVSDGPEKTVVPFSRVNSHMVPEDGSILCSEPGICMFLLSYVCSCHNCAIMLKLHYFSWCGFIVAFHFLCIYVYMQCMCQFC